MIATVIFNVTSLNLFIRNHRSNYPRNLVSDMLLMAASLIGGFIFAALLTEGDVDDDDNGPGGGLMQPAYVPTP